MDYLGSVILSSTNCVGVRTCTHVHVCVYVCNIAYLSNNISIFFSNPLRGVSLVLLLKVKY